jgi:hypothetical protein
VILVVTALRQCRDRGHTALRLKELLGVTRPTLVRWQRYFHETFIKSRPWNRLAGRLVPPVSADRIPRELIERFVENRGDLEIGLISCMKALAVGTDP